MTIQTNAQKEQVLFDAEGKFLGKIVRENWSSYKAEITTQFAEFISLTPNFWHTEMTAKMGDTELATMKMSWRGGFKIHFLKDDRTFSVSSATIWQMSYVVKDENERPLFTLVPKVDIMGIKYDYTIEIAPNETANETVILLAVYSVNLLVNTASG